MRVTIDLDERYTDVISIVAIGHSAKYQQNVSVACLKLCNGNHITLRSKDDHEENMEWLQEVSNDK